MPKNRNAMKLKNAAHRIAQCGRIAPVETMVAIELAASWKPFMKSNASARATRKTIICKVMVGFFLRYRTRLSHPWARRASSVLQYDLLNNVGDVFAAVGHFLEQ